MGKGYHFWEQEFEGLSKANLGKPLVGRRISTADVGEDEDSRHQVAAVLAERWEMVEGENVGYVGGFPKNAGLWQCAHLEGIAHFREGESIGGTGKDRMPVWEVARRDESDWALVASNAFGDGCGVVC